MAEQSGYESDSMPAWCLPWSHWKNQPPALGELGLSWWLTVVCLMKGSRLSNQSYRIESCWVLGRYGNLGLLGHPYIKKAWDGRWKEMAWCGRVWWRRREKSWWHPRMCTPAAYRCKEGSRKRMSLWRLIGRTRFGGGKEPTYFYRQDTSLFEPVLKKEIPALNLLQKDTVSFSTTWTYRSTLGKKISLSLY